MLLYDDPLEADALPGAADLYGEEMPSPSDYLSTRQRDGKPLGADALFTETWLWLKERRCEKFVSPRLLEAYAQAFARYIQCEEAISTYGLLGKHPTTGGAITSPFVQMSQSFQKQANLLWYEIFDIVKQNCTTAFVGSPQDDLMETLLSRKGGR
ncbi:P27 family phage terminase small subunit [Eubacteriales bacterium OttesenSCG-928-N13]|nr:P27 family phage terminase small subunit [Eubacteriales bacterium OttesenSCG-928-N13]